MVRFDDVRGIPIASIIGELDLANVQEIRDEIEAVAEGQPQMIVSFERCGFCDSQGIGMLVGLHRLLGEGMVVVVPPESTFRRVLRIVGGDDLFRIAGTLDDAVALLDGAPA